MLGPMAITDTVSRLPRRVARAGLLLGESYVERTPLTGERLSWFASNLLAVNGVTSQLDAAPPAAVAFVLPTARLIPALAVLAHVPVMAIGPSLAHVPLLGRVPCWAARYGRRGLTGPVLLTIEDRPELVATFDAGRVVSVQAESTEQPGADAPGYLRAATRRTSHVRLSWAIRRSPR